MTHIWLTMPVVVEGGGGITFIILFCYIYYSMQNSSKVEIVWYFSKLFLHFRFPEAVGAIDIFGGVWTSNILGGTLLQSEHQLDKIKSGLQDQWVLNFTFSAEFEFV